MTLAYLNSQHAMCVSWYCYLILVIKYTKDDVFTRSSLYGLNKILCRYNFQTKIYIPLIAKTRETRNV